VIIDLRSSPPSLQSSGANQPVSECRSPPLALEGLGLQINHRLGLHISRPWVKPLFRRINKVEDSPKIAQSPSSSIPHSRSLTYKLVGCNTARHAHLASETPVHVPMTSPYSTNESFPLRNRKACLSRINPNGGSSLDLWTVNLWSRSPGGCDNEVCKFFFRVQQSPEGDLHTMI
jgi:hypothetical protein